MFPRNFQIFLLSHTYEYKYFYFDSSLVLFKILNFQRREVSVIKIGTSVVEKAQLTDQIQSRKAKMARLRIFRRKMADDGRRSRRRNANYSSVQRNGRTINANFQIRRRRLH